MAKNNNSNKETKETQDVKGYLTNVATVLESITGSDHNSTDKDLKAVIDLVKKVSK